ncbi:tetratricopeptide repeat protein [Nocardia sp. CY41]|uniref:tetratricopeptide repeat protein n=1 Tax=Nocardia sp. CY41 TaxID=2608686 RepID=UPI001358327B|nr:tetratricopeptide repeat protein [Nocardia sp. CY41]
MTPDQSRLPQHPLAAYLDLSSTHGPLQAQIVADLGYRFTVGEALPSYQTVTSADLRVLISLDAQKLPYLEDPRTLPPDERTPPWQCLCENLDAWEDLPAQTRLRTVQIVAKLGFWQIVADLAGDARMTVPATSRPMAHLSALAQLRTGGDTQRANHRIAWLAEQKAADESLSPAARLSAAINLTVHYARTEGLGAQCTRWQSAAKNLADTVPTSAMGGVLGSAYWRGMSLLSFLAHDYRGTASLLERAEDCARNAVGAASPDRLLAAQENLQTVLDTRGRAAWTSGDLDRAESYFCEAVELDPHSSMTHVRLGDFLTDIGQFERALAQFSRAAELGAPCTQYARARSVMLESGGRPPARP